MLPIQSRIPERNLAESRIRTVILTLINRSIFQLDQRRYTLGGESDKEELLAKVMDKDNQVQYAAATAKINTR